jgi:hypothetical protein
MVPIPKQTASLPDLAVGSAMDIQLEVRRQRVKHIVDSYHLQGDEVALCEGYLEELIGLFPMPALELALVETILQNWLTIPMPRGKLFFDQVRALLQHWKETTVVETLVSMEQFHHITGLDPAPVFGPELPPQFPVPRTVS